MLRVIIGILLVAAIFCAVLLKLKNKGITEKLNLDISETEETNESSKLKFFINKKVIIPFCSIGILVAFCTTLSKVIVPKAVNRIIQAENRTNSDGQIKGINLSNNDKNVDLNSVAKAGGEYVYLKATEGATFKDSDMDAYYQESKKLGMKVGAYHYLVSTSSPEEQARNFYNMISKYDWDLIPMLDTEVYFDGLEDYIKRFKDEFNRLSSLKLGIYTYTSFINKYLNNADKEIYNMPLWEANYNGKPWNGVGKNKFVNLVGHQYSTDQHIKEYIGNFNGDINEFNDKILISNE
ncbi:GH25 family lysozyme [Clostridium sp. SM-530-WT-3G]|uniref:GH25 family lysozyme n=1 Tax=Clostridium sp. SM-530-WT-3G TaxID=2725303 RepID=UPI00145E2797|nr:GH25 family lysozyme [Clostridium sp. SM-530-WT-3G]NME81901.1 autolysin [Clostridium sp. SM-530-WT-3G]